MTDTTPLRLRVEALENKYETMRLATLEWGKDVDQVKRWSDQHLQRIMALETEAAKRSAFELSDDDPIPQRPVSARSLVEQVAIVIGLDDEPLNWHPEARRAIRVVIDWLEQFEFVGAVHALRQEAGP